MKPIIFPGTFAFAGAFAINFGYPIVGILCIGLAFLTIGMEE